MLKFIHFSEINFNICILLIIKYLQNAPKNKHLNCAKFSPYNILIKTLLSSTEVEFSKNLIRTWVEFGKKMVYGKQGVTTAKKWRFFESKC